MDFLLRAFAHFGQDLVRFILLYAPNAESGPLD
jgi:hypothetical protein